MIFRTYDWQELDQEFDWIRAMREVPQDPVHHAEGDVWTHVRMVGTAMLAHEEWRSLADPDRNLLFAAALLHDVAKSACTRIEEDGRVTSRGHSRRGAIQTRRILWEHGHSDLSAREELCALIRFHQYPFYLIERTDALRSLRLISQSARCSLLALLATADALGRTCRDQADILTRVALFRELARENDCLDQPWRFPSALSRFEYLRREDRDPHYAVHENENPGTEVILMSGLPGAGKDTWIRDHAPDLPVISLDDIRGELEAKSTGHQGAVVQRAKERARECLRPKSGTPAFVWNATNLSRDMRSQLIDLFVPYGARVRIVYVEAPYDQLFERNALRERKVPAQAIERMLDRWEVPDVTEAPVVEWWQNGSTWTRVSS